MVFYLISAIILGSTAMAITRRNQVHAAIYLIFSFIGTALLFYLLGAPLLAALELIIYAGAIMILFLFIIMTLRTEKPTMDGFSMKNWALPIALGVISFAAAGALIYLGPISQSALGMAMASPAAFGEYLFQHYWLPVEIASFLLFVALVGVLYIGRRADIVPASEPVSNKDIP